MDFSSLNDALDVVKLLGCLCSELKASPSPQGL